MPTANSTSQVASFDPLSPAFAANPYTSYAKLRLKRDLIYYEPYDMWMVPWHAEVSSILRTATMVRSLEGLVSEDELQARAVQDNWHDMPYHSRFVQFSMLDSDGAVHGRLRAHVAQAFGPSSISKLEHALESYVSALLDEAADRQRVDFIEDIAALIPGRVIGALMGMPEEDCGQLRQWSEDIVQYFDVDRSDSKKRLAEATTESFYFYLDTLKKERLARPRKDLLTSLAQLEAAGELTEDECISTCMLIVMAGHGSTLDVLGSGLHLLLRFPDQLARLRSEGGLMPLAAQEIFRFEPPLPFFHRYATEPTQVRGQEFARGTRFGLLYGSANRDQLVFENADTFDITRRPNRHRAFGGGAHFCLGNHLARMTVEVVFRQLLEKFESIDLVEQPKYKTGLSVRGPQQLRIAVHPR